MELKKYKINLKIKLDKEVEIGAYSSNQALDFLKNISEDISDFLEIDTEKFDKKNFQYQVIGIEKDKPKAKSGCENCEYYCKDNESCIFPNARL